MLGKEHTTTKNEKETNRELKVLCHSLSPDSGTLARMILCDDWFADWASQYARSAPAAATGLTKKSVLFRS